MNSGMAQGAVQALEAQGLTGKVFVAGADADLAAIKNIVNGKQQFEVVMDIEALARMAARAASTLAKGGKPESDKLMANGSFKVPVKAMGVYGVTKDNLEERIFKTGFHPREAVYGSKK
jgi:D-xylose transport system substrate-binding protein